jgi:hypothetical protein
MSADGVLERTRQSDLQPLVANGVPVFRMYGQIRVELLRSLSQEHLALFADPNADPVTGDIQWFAPFPGEISKLADCSEDDRAGYEFHLARLVDDITNHIDKLNESGAENSRNMANVLTMALEIPDESHIFVVGGRPVIAGWGHVPRGPAVLRKPLIALVRRVLTIAPPVTPPEVVAEPAAPADPQKAVEEQPKPVEEPAKPDEQPAQQAPSIPADGPRAHALIPIVNEVVGQRRPVFLNWLLWPILGVLLVSIGYFLLRYCGLGWPFSSIADNNLMVNYCVASSQALRSDDLSAHLADLQQSLAEKQRRLCETAARRPPQPETKDLVEEAGGTIGAVNVILSWHTLDDLDLHVTCPSGEQIYYSNKNKCGGVLDVDMNSSSGTNKSTSPVENVTWPVGAAQAGTYKVEVDPYRRDSSQPIEFKVELLINGQKKEEYSRHFDAPGKMSVFEFTLPYTGRRQQ